MRRIQLAWLTLALSTACGGSPTNDNGNNNGNPYPQDPGGTPEQAVEVEVRDDVFVPNSVVVAVGGTVTFRWIGTNGHSVTPRGASTFSPTAPVSYPPKDLVVAFSSAGTYHYNCIIHGASDGYGSQGNMIGTVSVR
ncbi:MAG TPA: hypothetical protein VJK71_11295 [Gemmatimonadales bacterium]|nr:hypothetical protein [Gemmatimonadales bacterium]